MSDRYTYKPRFGFDIRIKPPRTDEAPIYDPAARVCDAPGCRRKAACRAPKSPQELNSYYWFCTEHAREYNRAWNFFSGMTEDEAAEFRETAIFGHRPTWKLGANAWATGAARANAKGPKSFDDGFGVFHTMAEAQSDTPRRGEVALTRLQTKAFQAMDLGFNATKTEIRQRYKDLLKRFHPDANGGDRGAEEKLQEVLSAYQIIKKAGFC